MRMLGRRSQWAPGVELRRLRAENAELRARDEDRQAVLAEMQQRYDELGRENADLRQQVADLQARLNANSRNSSKPPSSDGPEVPPRPRKKPSGRKRGGQPGHKGTTRPLPTREEADEETHCIPAQCERCGAPLEGRDPDPEGRPITEIPKPTIRIIWYWLHTLRCPRCGHATQARAPGSVGQSPFGVEVHALCAVLVGRFRLSKQLVQELLGTLYGLSVSTGTVCAVERRVSAALADPVEEARAYLRRQDVVHADETGWKRLKRKAWLWVAATEKVASYWIDRRRSSQVVKRMLGETFGGILVVDRWRAYVRYRRAYCWAHLKRDFEAMIERYSSPWHGRRLVCCTQKILALWQQWHQGEISRQAMVEQMAPLQVQMETLLDWTARNAPGKKARKKAGEILRHKECLWRFVADERVPPTNNHGERMLRPAVILRKLIFGNDSMVGSEFTERILTTVETLRLQDRNVFDFLCEAIDAHNQGRPAPSLLPPAPSA